MSEKGAEGQLRRRAEAVEAPPETVRLRAPAQAPAMPSGMGYWSYMSLVVFVLFVFYVTGKGELQQWMQILIPSAPAAPKAQGAGQQPSGYGSAVPQASTPASGGGGSSGGAGSPPSINPIGSPTTPGSGPGGATTGNAPSGFFQYWLGVFTGK